MNMEELFNKFKDRIVQKTLDKYEIDVLLIPKEDNNNFEVEQVLEKCRAYLPKKKEYKEKLTPKQKELIERKKKILDMLKAKGPLAASDVAEEIETSRQTAYNELNKLEEEGKVKSNEVEKDNFSYFEWSINESEGTS